MGDMPNETAFYTPPELPVSQSAEVLITAGSGLAVVVAFVVAIRYWRVSRSAIPLFLLVGAGLALINEPFVDLLGKCYMNGAAGPTIFEIFGRPMALWCLFAYIIIYGVVAWVIVTVIKRGASRTQVWGVLGALLLVQVAMEMVILPTGLYFYYGYQPWAFFDMPMHWLAINFSGTFLSATVLVLAEPYLTGRRQMLVLLLPMVTQVVCSYFVGLPVFASLHSGGGPVVMWIGGAATIVIALIIIELLNRLVQRRFGDRPSNQNREKSLSR